MIQLMLTVVTVSVVALLVLGIFAAMAFFIGLVTYGWVQQIAPADELAALPRVRRRIVLLRALVVVGVFWLVLLSVNAGSRTHSNPDTGQEAFAYWRSTLRRLAGLPRGPLMLLAAPLLGLFLVSSATGPIVTSVSLSEPRTRVAPAAVGSQVVFAAVRPAATVSEFPTR